MVMAILMYEQFIHHNIFTSLEFRSITKLLVDEPNREKPVDMCEQQDRSACAPD